MPGFKRTTFACKRMDSVLGLRHSARKIMATQTDTETLGNLRCFVPVLCWCVVLVALLCIPFKIIGYGYLPAADALRYAGKAVSGKAWSEVLVLREGTPAEHNAGWETILSRVHQVTHWEPDSLVAFSVTGLLLLFALSPLVWLRRPEAWIISLFIGVVASPYLMFRLTSGRPYLVTSSVLMALLFMWARPTEARVKTNLRLVLTTALVALAVWIHGCWYLFALLVAAFVLARQWKSAVLFMICWLLGSLLGAAVTGNPFVVLAHEVAIVYGALSQHLLQRQLVTELASSNGDIWVFVCVILLLLWRASRGRWRKETVFNPAFMLAVLGGLLGFKVLRFWLDWGLPAALVWMTIELQEEFERHIPSNTFPRLYFPILAAAGLFLSTTTDVDGRWTNNLAVEYLSTADPEVAPWLPQGDGIIYSANMDVFYETFFKNPRASWRYILGFEPTFMPEEDLKILRTIEFNHGAPETYLPWVRKMRTQDRLIIRTSSGRAPGLPGLEWRYAVKDTWIGRL